jgi:hypothetical protein
MAEVRLEHISKLYESDKKIQLKKERLIGIRPEDVFIFENNNNKPDCILKIMAFENMGNEQLVYFSFPD